jgi:solute carrier family 25 S-adenosylmethionine transporter 26
VQAKAASPEAPTTQPSQPSTSGDKPLLDVLAGAMARAASQSAIHPIDTIKVRMQAGKAPSAGAETVHGLWDCMHITR